MTKLLECVRARFISLRSDGIANVPNRFGKFIQARLYRLRRTFQKVRYETKLQTAWPPGRPLISVIIPCFNYGIYLKGAIESVLSQTFQRLEIIVINDGSTDVLTKEILQGLRYPKTRVVHQRNQGLAQTRNIGSELAAGKYVCYLDADDFIEPTYLEKTLAILESDESLGSCYSWVRCFGDRDSVWRTSDLEPFWLKRGTTASSHSVIRKAAWGKVKEFNGSGFLSKYDGYFEDWVFWIDLVQCGYRGQVIEEPLIRYRVHKLSLGATHKPGFDKMVKVLHEDRKRFFYDRQYMRDLELKLNQRIYIENNRINLLSPEYYKGNRVPDRALAGSTQNRQAAGTYGV